jgi:hypothetical protein
LGVRVLLLHLTNHAKDRNHTMTDATATRKTGTDPYDTTIIVIAPLPSGTRGWRRLITAIDPTKTGAFALTGQSLEPGGCYRAQHGALIVAVDTHHDHRDIRLLRVHPGGMDTVKQWRQQAPLGQRIVKYVAARLPAGSWRAGPVAGVPNRFPGRCHLCGLDVPVGGGAVAKIAGTNRVTHVDQCPPRPPTPNERDGYCHLCGKPVPSGAGLLDREWDDLTSSPKWTVRHTDADACVMAPMDFPNRWSGWCADCGRIVRQGHGVWRDRAVRCANGCRPMAALPSWTLASRDAAWSVGDVFRAAVAPRPGERDVPVEAPGRHALDEGMVSVIVAVVDTHRREDGLRMAQVRAATWDEASGVLADEVALAVDAKPNPRGFKAAWAGEKIGDRNPWLAEITGHDRRFGLRRAFLPPRRDYLDANSRGTRGVMFRWILSPNAVYEAYRPTSWKAGERLFLRVTPDGGVEEITQEQVEARLLHGTAWIDPLPEEDR